EDEELYGVPISTDVRGLWYNKKAFENAGIDTPWEPENWDEVLEAVNAIKDDVEVPFWANSGKAMGEGTTMQTFLPLDRKSTRLNSSHVSISYAVFCLKKKRK